MKSWVCQIGKWISFFRPLNVINALSPSKVPMSLQNQIIHIFTLFEAHECHEAWGVRNCCGCGISIHWVFSDHHITSVKWKFLTIYHSEAASTALLFWYGEVYQIFSLCLHLTLQSVAFICVRLKALYTLHITHIHIHSFPWIELLWKYLALNGLVVCVFFVSHFAFLIQAHNLLNSTFIPIFVQPLVVIVFGIILAMHSNCLFQNWIVFGR